jgi:hypothetical protein
MSAEPNDREVKHNALTALERRIRETCSAAVELFGVEAASRIWNDALRVHKSRRGRPQKNELRDWDRVMLSAYLTLKNDPHPETLVRHIAGFHFENNIGKWQSRESLEKRIRRLVDEYEAGKWRREEHPGMLPPYRYVRTERQ